MAERKSALSGCGLSPKKRTNLSGLHRMNRPRLFLSTVSEELRTARQAVAATVRTIGFDPVSQDDFPTGYG